MADIRRERLIRLSKSCLSDAEKLAVMGVLDREFLGMGAEVQQFEQALGAFFGRPTVCVVNGTSALHLSLQACGVGPGDEVLVQSLTYVASFQAISATGAVPVACDVDSETLTLNWRDAEKRVTARTKAVMPVHYSGDVGALDEIYEFARCKGLRVIEDAAHAFGTVFNDFKVGGFGDISCFSFDGIKNITSGEGGCIVTEDEEILRRVKDSRLLGVERDTERRYAGERSWDFNVRAQGWRYHMSEIMAAIGRVQLNRFSEFAFQRQHLAKLYDRLFLNHSVIQPLAHDYDKIVPHIYVVRIHGIKNRTSIQQQMAEKGIQVGYHYQPNHVLDFFKNPEYLHLPVTEKIFPELLTLPLHPDLTDDDVNFVALTLIQLLEGYGN